MGHTDHRVLVVGNYCHDVLLKDDVVLATSLGGAASFISNIFTRLSLPSVDYLSKVGPDFNYPHAVSTPPLVGPTTSNTTVFHAHFSSSLSGSHPTHDRTLKRVAACDPILPSELPYPGGKYRFGLAVGVGGEILPATMDRLLDICDHVFVDVQGLIRQFDEVDGTVRLVNLKETGFFGVIDRVAVLKASAEEAEYVDVEEVRKKCCVVVTDGERGCRVYWKDGEVGASPFEAKQVDPTGAGDSLLGGFVAGLVYGLSVPDAAVLGNFFGALTVEQLGLPNFDHHLLLRVKDEVQKRSLQCAAHRVGNGDELWFAKPPGHEEFHESLNAVRQASAFSVQELDKGPPDMHNHITQAVNHSIHHLCNGQKVLHDPVYDEHIEPPE